MVLGKGGFGKVYHGYIDDNQVAVKMLSPSSFQGCKQFQAEVKILMSVHHKYLTTLVGYCDEGTNTAFIYEFMAKGNLQEHLLEKDGDILSWEARLRIATQAAQVVLLEIITSKPVIDKSTPEWTHKSKWVKVMLANEDIRNIVDPRLHGDFDMDSGRKTIEVAMACVSLTSSKRPTMNQVVIELNRCIAIETARKTVANDTESEHGIESINSKFQIE
ncbi:hypothetical protein Pint_29497 [Pistacia integerrima]|uniref:Uncharacterized protein n=1 Tax=Pistacia integerrima TaxID=434235 RepID=A0ACC0X3U7_9ROSI|nr:hypothetical protein Pint_29497 [Pistacia integerrima]